MGKVRPYIDENLVIKIKVAFPKETALMDLGETVEFAMKKALEANTQNRHNIPTVKQVNNE